MMFGKLGANVVVNDVTKDGAEKVVEEVKKGTSPFPPCEILLLGTNSDVVGGQAVAAVCSAEDGDAIVKAGVDAFGTVHILVANAGILRDKAFVNMDEKMWDQVMAVHLRGTFKVSFHLPLTTIE